MTVTSPHPVSAEPTVLVRQTGRILHLTLNRPRRINALTPEMIALVSDALTLAEHEPSIEAVVLDGAGERGLCSGGDITQSLGDLDAMKSFWAAEYALFGRIHHFAKPWISLMDGITMGGGIGMSAHSSVRVVTERSRIAMPEVRIGFIPDVGGTFILSRSPGELGTHLALTAADAYGVDAIVAGFADHYVASASLPALVDALAHGAEGMRETVAAFEAPRPEPALATHRDWIDEAYAADSVLEIVERLDARPEPAAHDASATIRAMAPNAVVTTLAALRRARSFGRLEDAFDLEQRIAHAFTTTWDFTEGVRAQIVEKDRNPKWRPARLEDVDEDWVRRIVG